MSQRSRWARGMCEGLRSHPPRTQPRVLAKCVAGIDYLVPFLDIGIVFVWLPGLILLLFGYPVIVGWWSLLLLPITLLIFFFLDAGRTTRCSTASTSTPHATLADSSATSSPTRSSSRQQPFVATASTWREPDDAGNNAPPYRAVDDVPTGARPQVT
jgi:hypothetical protein